MLENMKYKNCVHNKEYIRISQKQPNITIPGAAYDVFNEDGSRYEGQTKLVWQRPNDEIPFPEFRIYPCDQRPVDPLEALALELTAQESASYTVYHVVRSCRLKISYTSIKSGKIKIYQNGQLIGSAILTENNDTQLLTMLFPEDKATVKICVDEGTVLIHALEFNYDMDE